MSMTCNALQNENALSHTLGARRAREEYKNMLKKNFPLLDFVSGMEALPGMWVPSRIAKMSE